MATKTIPWDTSNPSKGDITLEANAFSGTQDVNVSTVENIGKTRSKRIVFYSTRNNMRSAPLTVVQNPATCSLEWNTTGATTIVVGYAADAYNLFIKSNISSKDYITVTPNNLPDGWSLDAVEAVSDGVYKAVLHTTKAGATNLSGSIDVTVGELDAVTANFTQNARYIVSSVYGNYTVANNSIKIAPKTGFTASQKLSAAGGTWGLFRGSDSIPTRVRTDTYNTGDVEYVIVEITDDVVLNVSAYNEAGNDRTLTVLKNLTWGELKGAIQGSNSGTDAVLQAGSLGTTYIEYTGYISVHLSCTDSEGNSYMLYTTGSKYDASDGKETWRVEQEPNVFESFDFSDTTETWFNQIYRYNGSQALMLSLPLLGGESIPVTMKLRVMTTFTSGISMYVNPYKIVFNRTSGNDSDVNYESKPVYPTIEEQLSTTPFEYQFKAKILAYGGYIDSEYQTGIYYDDLFKPSIYMTDKATPDYNGSPRGAVYFGATAYGAVVHSSGWTNGQIDRNQRHLLMNVGFREADKMYAYKANANDPHIQLSNKYVTKYSGNTVLMSDPTLTTEYISEASYYSELDSDFNIPALWNGQKLGEIAQNTSANGAFNWIQMHICKGALIIPVGNYAFNSYGYTLSCRLYMNSGWIQEIAQWSVPIDKVTPSIAGYSLFRGTKSTGAWDGALDKISNTNYYPLFLEITINKHIIM